MATIRRPTMPFLVTRGVSRPGGAVRAVFHVADRISAPRRGRQAVAA